MKWLSVLVALQVLQVVLAFLPGQRSLVATEHRTDHSNVSRSVAFLPRQTTSFAIIAQKKKSRAGRESALQAGGSSHGPVRIIIAGAPASGKGTQCERIKEKFGVVHLSTGDMLRAAVAAGTDVGKEAKSYMDSGKLVPDSVIIGVVSTTELYRAQLRVAFYMFLTLFMYTHSGQRSP